MKPIVIAGNGPSLAKIDYTRLPQDFDVFRCNQFYFEDRYFLGKKIKGVFFNPSVFKEQYFTLQELIERGEYEIDEVYCMRESDREILIRGETFAFYFPNAKNTFDYLQKLPKFLELDRLYRLQGQWLTAGMVMLYTALAQGYKEIYLIGIDLYRGGGIDYAFEVKNKKNLCSKIPEFKNASLQSKCHTASLDLKAIKLALNVEGVKLYGLSQEAVLNELLPLSPIQNPNPMQILPKPEGYICDFVELPKLSSKKAKLDELLRLTGIPKDNLFIKVLVDFVYCLRGVWRLLKKFIKR